MRGLHREKSLSVWQIVNQGETWAAARPEKKNNCNNGGGESTIVLQRGKTCTQGWLCVCRVRLLS